VHPIGFIIRIIDANIVKALIQFNISEKRSHYSCSRITTPQFDCPHLTKFLKLYVTNVGFVFSGNGEGLPDKWKDTMKL